MFLKTITRLSRPEIASSVAMRSRPFLQRRMSSQMGIGNMNTRTSILNLQEKYKLKVPISMITAYDYSTAKSAHEAGVDMILVGDSLGMVVLGHSSTVPVTLDDMLRHAAAVTRTQASRKAFVVGDLPFGSYNNIETAVHNSTRMMQEGGVDAIKLEGGKPMVDRIRAIVENGIPVVGHIGLTPQTFSSLGGYRVQGRTADSALKLLEDALALQEAGCFSIVLETVPSEIARHITSVLRVPTIGIGAGAGTSGQVLVAHDMLGMFDAMQPKFVKKYSNLGVLMREAIQAYHEDVINREFPAKEHSFGINAEQLQSYIEKASRIIPNHTSEATPKETKKQWFKQPTAVTKSASSSYPIQRVAVIGGGAMGSLFAGALGSNPSLCEVTLISDWSEHVRLIKEQGLQLVYEGATSHPSMIQATMKQEASRHFATSKADLAIILTKAGSMARAIELVNDIVVPGGAVLTLQNGMGYQDQLLSLHHKYHLMRGVTFNGASIVTPGVLQLNGQGQSVIAPFNPESYESDFQVDASPYNDLDVCKSIAALFNQFGMETLPFPDNNAAFERILWEKLAVNSVINPLTAIFNVRNGELLNHDVAREFIPLLVNEICSVLQDGLLINISREAIEKRISSTLYNTANNVSSMLADVRRQVPTEIEFMNGQIVKLGLQNKIDVPHNSIVVGMIKEMEMSFKATQEPVSMGTLDPKARDLVLRMRQHALFRSSVPFSRRSYSTAAKEIFVAKDIPSFRQFRSSVTPKQTLGFVPTMGALHSGHLSLVEAAKNKCDKVAVSIFVNPTQFAAHEDLGAYPRTLERDLQLLTNAGVDAVFAPADSTVMYPPGFSLSVHVPDATNKKEGIIRPHHFDGVATVCLKLFNIAQPSAVFFGQKDAQQCATIRALVRDFNIPTEVVIVPTSRDENGLALSSRNAYLSVEEKQASRVLYATLKDVEKRCLSGERNADVLRAIGLQTLASDPLSKPQYISIADLDTMKEIEGVISDEALHAGVCVAVASKVGKVRLIDNYVIKA